MNEQYVNGWTETDDGDAAGALTVTHAAVEDKSHFVSSYLVTVISGTTDAAVTVELKDGSTTIWKDSLKTGATVGDRVGMVFREPVRMSPNTAVSLVVSDPGTAGTLAGNIAGSTK